jgi:hypothetical protein
LKDQLELLWELQRDLDLINIKEDRSDIPGGKETG